MYDGSWTITALLGRFTEDIAELIDTQLGTDWADNEEILALLALLADPPPTTRQLAESSRMNRRAISRLVARLRADGIADTRPSRDDRRAVRVHLTDLGRARFAALDRAADTLLRGSGDLAATLLDELGGPDEDVLPAPEALDTLRQLAEFGAEMVRALPAPAGPASLSARQRVTLVRIAAGQAVRPVDLTAPLGVGRSGVAYVIDQLGAKGLIERRRSALAEDRRAVVLIPTPAGRDAAERVRQAIGDRAPALRRIVTAIRARSDAGPGLRPMAIAEHTHLPPAPPAGHQSRVDPETPGRTGTPSGSETPGGAGARSGTEPALVASC